MLPAALSGTYPSNQRGCALRCDILGSCSQVFFANIGERGLTLLQAASAVSGKGKHVEQTGVTVILDRASSGDQKAITELFPLVYAELRAIAAGQLQQERAGHTLQPTALVNEAFMKIVGGAAVNVSGRSHFLAVASRAMRQILVDHARGRNRVKRGGGGAKVSLDEAITQAADSSLHLADDGIDLEALDVAMLALAERYPREARLVELRFFGGLTEPEAAQVLGISARTASLDWAFARAWLKKRFVESQADRPGRTESV